MDVDFPTLVPGHHTSKLRHPFGHLGEASGKHQRCLAVRSGDEFAEIKQYGIVISRSLGDQIGLDRLRQVRNLCCHPLQVNVGERRRESEGIGWIGWGCLSGAVEKTNKRKKIGPLATYNWFYH
ncbi:bis(5'-nucleosyl)-tetraphosphatase [Striga asiatica]|uniref:Bis(5'-nucleosyl)-tetraphosphatase n=1 Tax=Striga asiatica TaxID=4170 RepID=A0A5A7PF39_STRAF|nr:bis(5'-nucleosyl)-tetraphosphatase [Striga asiatica]